VVLSILAVVILTAVLKLSERFLVFLWTVFVAMMRA
jgi:hypothetical protein